MRANRKRPLLIAGVVAIVIVIVGAVAWWAIANRLTVELNVHAITEDSLSTAEVAPIVTNHSGRKLNDAKLTVSLEVIGDTPQKVYLAEDPSCDEDTDGDAAKAKACEAEQKRHLRVAKDHKSATFTEDLPSGSHRLSRSLHITMDDTADALDNIARPHHHPTLRLRAELRAGDARASRDQDLRVKPNPKLHRFTTTFPKTVRDKMPLDVDFTLTFTNHTGGPIDGGILGMSNISGGSVESSSHACGRVNDDKSYVECRVEAHDGEAVTFRFSMHADTVDHGFSAHVRVDADRCSQLCAEANLEAKVASAR
ncbi:MAG TPA: hypothetical protein VE172_05190 [Stackebrandtia sp.]|jgi:hypothetical protein|uniref:hypothetical protein n=1 Tax=Stackebrandtia sp. TaxID=2023065 RepID=UPI002D3654E7|nr:hypothetical protein [Stackebrandtia sp.]HZE38189.1 hypothetical protein [Stackebrandtia sp.]